jgi:hypothetical protein
MTYTRLARYVQDWHDIRVHNPIPLITPFTRNPCPHSRTPFLFTWNPSFASWCDSRPLRSLVGRILTFPHPICSPFSFPLAPTVPHFKYMLFYDDITISASHSPIQFGWMLLHQCDIHAQRTEGYSRNMTLPHKHSTVICLKVGHAWAILRGLGERLGRTACSSQTKSCGIIPLLESYVWRCGTCVHVCSKHVPQVGDWFIFYLLFNFFIILQVNKKTF